MAKHMGDKKRGNPNWTKGGASPNPTGRPPLGDAEREAREILRAATPDAALRLVRLLSEAEDEGNSLRAALAVLERVMGKTPSAPEDRKALGDAAAAAVSLIIDLGAGRGDKNG
jgi:hypothetical protein